MDEILEAVSIIDDLAHAIADGLGDTRTCAGCAEEWPDDEEFFRRGDDLCRACRAEREAGRAARRAEYARAYRRRKKGGQ